jgi:SAM-dependent methyltransferase
MTKNYSPHINEEKRYFNSNSKYFISLSKKDLIWQVPEKIIFIDRYINPLKKWSYLDIGCGSAENIKVNLLPLMKEDDIYMGVDISEKLLKKAKKNIPTGIFINKPMGSLKFDSNKFDYISFFGSLHHDEFPQKTLNTVSKFLKSSGFLFLREPNEKAFKKGCGASPHEGGFNPKELTGWLKQSGLEILEWHDLNTTPFHLLRKILSKVRLSKWERRRFIWKFKVNIEMLSENFIARHTPYLKGTDMFIVSKKK